MASKVDQDLIQKGFKDLVMIEDRDEAKILMTKVQTSRELSDRIFSKFEQHSKILGGKQEGTMECDIPFFFMGKRSEEHRTGVYILP